MSRSLFLSTNRLHAASTPLAVFIAIWLASASASAQSDRVFPVDGNPVNGKIVDVSPNGLTVESGSRKQAFAVDEIAKIMYEGDPGTLTKGREFALDGQWDQAIEELKKVNFAELKRDVVKNDAAFYLALSESKLALAGRGSTTDAVAKMMAVVRADAQSIHFYDAAKTLGDLAVALGKYDQAVKYYGALASATSPDLKIEAAYLIASSKLRQNDAAGAQADFDKVLGVKAESTKTARLQILSRAGRAVALAKQGKGDEALKMVDQLVTELNPADTEIAAAVYNAQGASHEATGDNLGAVLAYLHTHLMFSGQATAHAEALTRLVDLWPKLGKPDRAAEARAELQQRYPAFSK